MKRSDPNRQLEFLLTEVVRLQLRVYNQRFRATGLQQTQVAALIHLDRIEELSQTDLAARLGMKKAATGTLIDGLEGKGLVERRRGREDRRLQLVSITDAGRDVVETVDRMAEELGTGTGTESREPSGSSSSPSCNASARTCARWRKRTGRRASSCLDSMARRCLDPPAGPSATSIGLVVVGAITRFVSGGSTDG